MTDYYTLTKLRKTDPTKGKLDGSSSQYVPIPKYSQKTNLMRSKETNYIVLTEDCEYWADFEYILDLLNLKKEDLPIIQKKYYKKEFIQKNWDIIFESQMPFFSEDTEEELEELIEFENYKAEEDWNLFELEDFSASKSFLVGESWVSLPDVSVFRDYENAFITKPVPAIIFEVDYVGNIPARFFGNLAGRTSKKYENTCYMSSLFNVNDIYNHFDTETEYAHIHEEEVKEIKDEYTTDEDCEEPHYIFLFG